MKKVILFILCLVFTTLAYAETGKIVSDMQWIQPDIAAVTADSTIYSDSIYTGASEGFGAALIASTAGTITVTQYASLDNVTFYAVQDTAGVSRGGVISGMTVGSKYVQFDPVFSPYVKFRIVESGHAPTTVTIKALLKRE